MKKTLFLTFCLNLGAWAHDHEEPQPLLIEVPAKDKYERSKIADLGYALEEFRSDKVLIVGTPEDAELLRSEGFQVQTHPADERWFALGPGAAQYHDYPQVMQKLQNLSNNYPQLASLSIIGRSVEGRDIPVLRISGQNLAQAQQNKIPTIILMGCHHAREHLSVEVPLLFAEYLVEQYSNNPVIKNLLDNREVFIAPIINPDGHIYDRSAKNFRMWRKNRRNNGSNFGVDLNRNYSYKWGTGGSSNNSASDVYMGPHPFSEPETQAVRDFVRSQPRTTMLLSFHTFSELVLYPWGHTYDPITKPLDLQIYKKMASQMAAWNNYTPQQSSDLYIASGDTTDWSYGELGIFSFTFELSPKSMFGGGFYPGSAAIQPTFQANIKPMLYMIEYALEPARVLTEKTPSFELTPSKAGIAMASPADLNLK